MAQRLDIIKANRQQRQKRVRAKIKHPNNRLRLSVSISNKHIRAQVIDDQKGQTLVWASTLKQDLKQPLSQQAHLIGQQIAQKCQAAKIETVVFDRGYKKYHQRLKNLAQSAREQGLKF